MDKTSLLSHYDDFRRDAHLPGHTQEVHRPPGGGLLVRQRAGAGAVTIVYTNLEPAGADSAIAEEVAAARRQAVPLEWLCYTHDRPAGLGARLQAQGFTPKEQETVLLLSLDEARLPAPSHGAAVRRATTPAELHAVASIRSQIWGGDAGAIARTLQAQARARPEQRSVYLAVAAGAPAATAQISFYPESGFASLGSAATLPPFRRRGLYSALLYARLTEARERGLRFVDTEASPQSRPLLERVGFRPVSQVTVYSWQPD